MSDDEEANDYSGSFVVTLDKEEGTPLTEVIDGAVGSYTSFWGGCGDQHGGSSEKESYRQTP